MLSILFAAALVGVDRPIVSGADFLEACTSRDARQQVACSAYFAGVVATAEGFHAQSVAAEPDRSFICPALEDNPEGAAVEAIQDEPALAKATAPLAILGALLKAFPCKGPAEPEPDEDLNTDLGL